MRALTLTIALLGWLLPAARATGQVRPENLDFEQGELGRVPTGWIVPTPGYGALLTDQGARQGQRCVLLQSERGAKESAPFGNIMQVVDAGAYRGKLVRLRAAVRVEGARATDRAQLWLRVDRAGGRMGFFDNMSHRPISESAWRYHEIVGAVVDDAERLNFGLMLIQQGRVWLDDVSLEVVGEIGCGLENLVAFTRLLGYVRYFHPSDQAAETDWEAFAVAGVRTVESADSAGELAGKLEELFRPIAPTVRVFPTGKVPPTPAELAGPPEKSGLRLVTWEHRGLGTGSTASIYYSKRVSADAKRGLKGLLPWTKSTTDLPDPKDVFVADLAGGVSCLVPLALYADSAGTLPHGTGSRWPVDSASRIPWSGNDRATRLADVALVWNILQHSYPYFDVIETDWEQALRDALTAAGVDYDERAFLDTLRRLISRLHDGHGRVTHRSDTANHHLPVVWDWVEGRLVITHVPEDAKVDLRAGDIVLKIDGVNADTALQKQEALISGATPQWRRWRALQELARHKAGERAALEIQDAGGETRSVTLAAVSPAQEPREPRPPKVHEMRPSIVYVDLDRIDDEDFARALPELEQARGIVFDLRGYPKDISTVVISHLIDKPVTCAQWHVPVVTRPDRQKMTFKFSNWKVLPNKPRLKAKLAFVTDGRAISYAETYMGIIEHYKLAEIVGGPTAGTNGNVNSLILPGGYRVVWTGMKVLKHDGSQHHGVGILPTVPVSRTIAGVRAARDELLEKAIKVVSE